MNTKKKLLKIWNSDEIKNWFSETIQNKLKQIFLQYTSLVTTILHMNFPHHTKVITVKTAQFNQQPNSD